MKTQHSLKLLCQSFEVSATGYYDWLKRQQQPGLRQRQDAQLKALLVQLHQQSRQSYGAPRLQAQLRLAGHRHGRNRIGRLMRAAQICGRQSRRFIPKTTNSAHDQPIADNWLAQLPAPQKPNQIWVADLTYIPTRQGWLYLAGLMDLYSRRIVGWAMSQHPDTQLVLDAWNMARLQRQPPAGLIFHSDRGVQYASGDFRKALQSVRAVASMSRKANCYDNAHMESFWSTLKLELVYRQAEGFADRAQARAAIFDYLECFYNRQRLHSALGYQSPVQFENASN